MIRIHLVFAAFPLPEPKPGDDCRVPHHILQGRQAVYEIFDKFKENIEYTVETGETPREDIDRLRASSNYVMYMLEPLVFNAKAMIDLTLDLANRPKRTVVVLCRTALSEAVDRNIDESITHLHRLFGESEVQLCNQNSQLEEFLVARQPQKTQEP